MTTPAPVEPKPEATSATVPPTSGTFSRIGGFLWWLITGFGLLATLTRRKSARTKAEEIVVYCVHCSFFLWALILTGFVGAECVKHYPNTAHVWGWIYVWVLMYTLVSLLFDIGTRTFLLLAGLFAFLWLGFSYMEQLHHVPILSRLHAYTKSLHPMFDTGFARVMSWLLLGPWIYALFQSFSRGRKTFSPNSIEEWYLGEGRDIIDRSGLKFRSRYRDLFESILGLGAGDLEAVDNNGNIVKRWENILFLTFAWRRLDEILHQRSAVVDNAASDPVEVEEVRR